MGCGVRSSPCYAHTFAAQGDIYNTAGCLTRTATTLTQVLFALNRCYFMTEKGALRVIEGFAHKPDGYGQAITAILAAPGQDAAALTRSVQALEALWRRVVDLTGGAYQPKFVLS